MRTRYTVLISFLIIILTAGNFLLTSSNRNLKKSNSELLELLRNLTAKNDHNEFIQGLVIKSVIGKEDKSRIRNEHYEYVDALKGSEKLVLFLPEGACGSCIVSALMAIEQLAERIGNDRILITTNWYSNGRVVRSADYGKDLRWFGVSSFGLGVEKLNHVFLFISNSELSISHLFVPELNSLERRLEFYNEIMPAYFTE